METTRISFDIDDASGYPVEALTYLAKRRVEKFIEENHDPVKLTSEQHDELLRRSERLRQHPETGVGNQEVFARLRAMV